MLLTVLLIAAAGILDKIAIPASDAIYYSFISTIGAVISLAATLMLFKINELPKLKSNIKEISIIGSLQGMSYTTYLIALGLGPVVYVASVRSNNVPIGSMLGILLLHEHFTKVKLLSFSLMTAGAIFLAFS